MLKLISSSDSWHLFKDDPVRPHLSALFRTAPGREAFVLEDELTGKPRAVICVAYTNQVPQDERELDYFSQAAHQEDEQGSIAVFYTVWSYDRGAGREIVFAAQDHTQARGCSRWVTLSPLTEMAERFHIKNGAVLHSRHSTCQNFEY
jgi:ectoine hydroxylase-related dioxygenase (phytanoyl-CoA dioxygenase family)